MKRKQTLDLTLYNIGEHAAGHSAEKTAWEQEGPVFSKQYEQKKAELLNNMKQETAPKRPLAARRAVVLAACLGVLFATSLCVYAAGKYFQTHVQETDDTLTYSFEIDYTLTPYQVEVTPGYLPQGYVEWEEGKYSYGGEFGADGISIAVFTAAHVDAVKDILSVSNVESWEETMLAGTTAHVIETSSDYGPAYNRTILFYEQEGFVVEVFATQELSTDEMIKVADQIEYTVTNQEDAYLSDKEKMEMEPAKRDPRDFTVTSEQIYGVGEAVGSEVHNTSFTIDKIEVLDVMPGFDTSLMQNYETMILPNLNPDGSLKDYSRMILDEKGAASPDQLVSRKFVRVEVTAVNQAAEAQDIFIAPYARYLDSLDAAAYQIDLTEYTGEDYEYPGLSYDGMPFYFSAAQDMEKGYYFLKLEPGESVSYTLLYDVDEDRMDDLYLFFNLNAEDYEYENPEQLYVKAVG